MEFLLHFIFTQFPQSVRIIQVILYMVRLQKKKTAYMFTRATQAIGGFLTFLVDLGDLR